jgi:co-chaperonin GroES (HSP10)
MSDFNIEPNEGNVVLTILDEGEKKTEAGIILAEGRNPFVTARVISVNPKDKWLKPGDIVFLRKAFAQDLSLDMGDIKIALISAISAKVNYEKKENPKRTNRKPKS